MRSCFARLLVAVVLLLLPCPPCPAAQPRLTMVFTANTLGTYGPCDRCEEAARGGLDRRATLMRQLLGAASARGDVLALAGGHEFLPFRVRKDLPAGLAPALVKAFDMLPYDLGYVTPREKKWLQDNGAEAPKGWLTAGDEPVRRVLRKGGMRVGIVIFPSVDNPFAQPGPEAVAAAAGACRALRPDVDLLVAMSPWNERNEKAFLDANGALADILLGSGPAMGAGARVEAEGRTLWLRAYYDGQIVPVLRLLDGPDADGRWRWMEGITYELESVPLGPDIKADPKVNNMFSWL